MNNRWDRSDTEEVVKGVLIAVGVALLTKLFDVVGDELEKRVRNAPKQETKP